MLSSRYSYLSLGKPVDRLGVKPVSHDLTFQACLPRLYANMLKIQLVPYIAHRCATVNRSAREFSKPVFRGQAQRLRSTRSDEVAPYGTGDKKHSHTFFRS
ncbi:hypothetical protein, partial [Pseudomonas savastanoi]|uniref:hypothetical protein n=1 Tax=Pseudomonas savastanoi TaxID=29438 RepID=UPI001E3F9643